MFDLFALCSCQLFKEWAKLSPASKSFLISEISNISRIALLVSVQGEEAVNLLFLDCSVQSCLLASKDRLLDLKKKKKTRRGALNLKQDRTGSLKFKFRSSKKFCIDF